MRNWLILPVVIVLQTCAGQGAKIDSDTRKSLLPICQQSYAKYGPDHRFESNGFSFHCLSETKLVAHSRYKPELHPQWKKVICKEEKAAQGDRYQYRPAETELQCRQYEAAAVAAVAEIERLEKLAQNDSYYRAQLDLFRVKYYELAASAHWKRYDWQSVLRFKELQWRYLSKIRPYHFVNIAHLHLLQDQIQKALTVLDQAKERFSENEEDLKPILKMQNDIKELLSLRKKIGQKPQDAETVFALNKTIWELRLFYASEDAKKRFLERLEKVIHGGKKVAPAYYLRAKYWFLVGEVNKAYTDLDNSLSSGLHDLSNIYEIAQLQSVNNNPQGSLRAAQQFFKVSPDERANLLLGHAYFELGQFENAYREYQRAIYLHRNARRNVSGLGSIEYDKKWLHRLAYVHYTQGKFQKAIDGLSKAIEKRGGDYTKFLYRAVVLNETSHFHAAQKDLLVFTDKLPELELTGTEKSDYHQAMGDNYYGLGDVGFACKHWSTAREIWSRNLLTSRNQLLFKLRRNCN